jgi:hypothetical protein
MLPNKRNSPSNKKATGGRFKVKTVEAMQGTFTFDGSQLPDVGVETLTARTRPTSDPRGTDSGHSRDSTRNSVCPPP